MENKTIKKEKLLENEIKNSESIFNEDYEFKEDLENDDQEIELDEDEINYVNETLSIRDIYNKHKRGALALPEIQREYNWNIKDASLLIDSILVGLPIPSIFLMEKHTLDEDNKKIKKTFIIDGGHRIKTIIDFINGNFKTENGQEFKIKNEKSKWINKSFKMLDEQKQNDFFEFRMNCTIFKPDNKAEWIYEIFRRINTNSNPLSPQELRESVFSGSYLNNIRENKNKFWLWKEDDMPENSRHKYKEKHSERFDKKSKGIELILRVIAYIKYFEKFGHLNMEHSLNKNVIIDEYLKKYYNEHEQSNNDINMFLNLLNKFENIGKAFFWKENTSYSFILFESLLLSVNNIVDLPSWLTEENFMQFKNDLNQLDSFTKSTTSYSNVVKRILIIKHFWKLTNFSEYKIEDIIRIDKLSKGELENETYN